MRIAKITIWIFVLFIIQTVFGRVISICGLVPDMLLAFSVIFAAKSNNSAEYMSVIPVCSVLDGVLPGRVFAAVVMLVCIISLIAGGAAMRLRYIHVFIKTMFIIAAGAFALAAAEYYISLSVLDIKGILYSVAPYAAYTLAVGCIMYPIMTRTLFARHKRSLQVL